MRWRASKKKCAIHLSLASTWKITSMHLSGLKLSLTLSLSLFLLACTHAQVDSSKYSTAKREVISTSIFVEGVEYRYSVQEAVVIDYIIDINAPYKNNCSYNRPIPSIRIVCRPPNTPTFQTLTQWPYDTIVASKEREQSLELYPEIHKDMYKWYDQKQAIRVTLDIYNFQGHLALSQTTYEPTNRITLPTSYSIGTCILEQWSHTGILERVIAWVVE